MTATRPQRRRAASPSRTSAKRAAGIESLTPAYLDDRNAGRWQIAGPEDIETSAVACAINDAALLAMRQLPGT